MSVKELIEELQNKGYSIEYRKRSDGGYLITKINGQKFTGAKGNTFARSVVGFTLSNAKIEQLSFNVGKYIKGHRKAKDKIDDELKKEIKRVQRLYRKMKRKGKITTRKVRYHLKTYGRKGAFDYLSRMEKYGRGIAYPENVEYLAQYVERVAYILHDDLYNQYIELAEMIRSKKENFLEEWIAPIYDKLYEVIKTKNEAIAKETLKSILTLIQ